jgi:hypothetical protein
MKTCYLDRPGQAFGVKEKRPSRFGDAQFWQKSDFGKNPEPSNHDHADEKRQVQRGQTDDVPNALFICFDAFGRNVILEDG